MEFEDRIPKLIAKYLRGTLITDEAQELDRWVCESEANRQFFIKATNEMWLTSEFKEFNKGDVTQRLNKTLKSIERGGRGGRLAGMKKYLIAACLVVIAGASIFLWTRNSGKDNVAKTTPTTNNNNDVQPGTEKAVLTLADGSKIILDNTSNGTIAQQGNTVVLKEDGLLAYNTDKTKSQGKTIYNTLTTARGQEFRSLVLADGTKVWLNSVSSITFPTAFIEKERIVEITGEAYFEVTKNPSRPFKVRVNGMEVEVLGTHFNVSCYSDESVIKTTLLEGLVKVVKGKTTNFLKPGEQAQVNNAGEVKVVINANVDEAIAWKNGMFRFHDLDIRSAMRIISRWYNVEPEYEGDVIQSYNVLISRSVPLSKLLSYMELAGGVHFKIDGNKILVSQ